MDGLARAMGDAIGGLTGQITNVISGGIRAIVAGAESLLPGPLLPIAVVALVLALVWLLRR